MRPIWSGVISFGLVNIPVQLYSPVKERLDLDYLHAKDRSPIRYARVCKEEEREVPYDDIVRGYELESGKYVVLTDEDFEQANVRKTRAIEIHGFVQLDEVDPLYFAKPYFLEPVEEAQKAYALLREAMERTKRAAIATFVLRNREHLAALRVHDNVLVLHQLRFADEITLSGELKLPKESSLSKEELAVALELIEKHTRHFKPGAYKDTYTDDLMAVIKAKAKGKAGKPHGKKPEPTKTADLMALLQESLKTERAHR